MSLSNRFRQLIVFAFLGGLLLGANEKAEASANIIVGVGVHRFGDYRYQNEMLPRIKQAGMTALRTDIAWSRIEKIKGVYEFDKEIDHSVDVANQQGIEPLLILDYGNSMYGDGKKPVSREAIQGYVKYAQAVVQHFGSRVRYFEIWNEWETVLGNTEPGRVDDYAELVKATYPAIKKVNPEAVVLVGAVSTEGLTNGWFERLAELGALKTADGLSVHPYVYQLPATCAPERAFGMIDALVSTLRSHYGVRLPVYITEIGWPTNQGKFGVSESVQAQMLERTLSLAASRSYMRGVWWYDLVDDGENPTDKEAHFGMLRYMTFEAKPAWSSMQKMTDMLMKRSTVSVPEALVPSPIACGRSPAPMQ